jgi:hypothetical protein
MIVLLVQKVTATLMKICVQKMYDLWIAWRGASKRNDINPANYRVKTDDIEVPILGAEGIISNI